MDDLLTVLAELALSYVLEGHRRGSRLGTRLDRLRPDARRARGRRSRGPRGATSDDTARLPRELGIPLVGFDGEELDVTVDGADEVDPAGSHQGLRRWAGARTHRRGASRRQIFLVHESRLVPRDLYPSQTIQPTRGELLWLVDRAAGPS